MCFNDESWPVRDEACLACGTLCLSRPAACLPELPNLLELWAHQLRDPVWSCRRDAASALTDAARAYHPPNNSNSVSSSNNNKNDTGHRLVMDTIHSLLSTRINSAKDEPPLGAEEAKRNINNIDLHTDVQLYSCGSLAPKMNKGRKAGAGRIGCMSCGVNRPGAKWEETDGCIYLLMELVGAFASLSSTTLSLSSQVPSSKFDISNDTTLLPLMTQLADVCRVRHFVKADDLRTTLWKNLPSMARSLGKKRFKSLYLDLFLDLLVDCLGNGNDGGGGIGGGGGGGIGGGGTSQLCSHAATQCAEELGRLVGPGILRGRIGEGWKVQVLDRALEERKRMERQPSLSGGASWLGNIADGSVTPWGR